MFPNERHLNAACGDGDNWDDVGRVVVLSRTVRSEGWKRGFSLRGFGLEVLLAWFVVCGLCFVLCFEIFDVWRFYKRNV